jgi:hypothetical protein
MQVGPCNIIPQRDATGGPLATTGPRQLLIRPVKLFVISYQRLEAHLFSYSEASEKIIILTSSAALRRSVTRVTDFKTLPQNVILPGENCVRYKLLQKKIYNYT